MIPSGNILTTSSFSSDVEEKNFKSSMKITVNDIVRNSEKARRIRVSKLTKPRRPLSGYDRFFNHECDRLIGKNPSSPESCDFGCIEARRRQKLLIKTNGVIGFSHMKKQIRKAWIELDDNTRFQFEAESLKDKARYRKELQASYRRLRKSREMTKTLESGIECSEGIEKKAMNCTRTEINTDESLYLKYPLLGFREISSKVDDVKSMQEKDVPSQDILSTLSHGKHLGKHLGWTVSSGAQEGNNAQYENDWCLQIVNEALSLSKPPISSLAELNKICQTFGTENNMDLFDLINSVNDVPVNDEQNEITHSPSVCDAQNDSCAVNSGKSSSNESLCDLENDLRAILGDDMIKCLHTLPEDGSHHL